MLIYGGFYLFRPLIQSLLLIALPLALAYFGAPFVLWAAWILGLLWLIGMPPWVGIVSTFVLLIFVIRPLRQSIVSTPLMKLLQALRIFPTVSQTERIALEAGTVWMDAELFSGKPHMDKLLHGNYPELTPEEKTFLDGPVATLCAMVDDWEVNQKRDLPEKAWAYIKEQRLFGMIIPKSYGGLGLSALANSAVVAKLSARSSALGITVMVPNSLGPAELIIHYGTDAQKNHYLPRLATGEEIPCFALTEPTAGSDAGSIRSHGVVFRGSDNQLYLKLNWEKRWITLGSKATLIGLAFQLFDPENFLGKGPEPGITCALIPARTPGIDHSHRHDPLDVPFYNSPLWGKDVVVSIDTIIGGPAYAGEGWRMLMESLAAGRGISLPANCTGGTQLVTRFAPAFGTVRSQFGLSIGKFEAIQDKLAEIAGYAYLLEAARRYTCGAIDKGSKPSVVTAIAKYHFTESFRNILNHGMDISGGAGISRGPRNVLANGYKAVPIGITVEGANILTRSLIIFGQGALRCHPYAYTEIKSIQTGDVKGFDRAFWGHVGHGLQVAVRSVLLSLTRGYLTGYIGTPIARYKRRLMWASASFACFSEIAMVRFGGDLKRKEMITARLGDILSWMYFASAVLCRFESEGKRHDDLPFAQWGLQTAFYRIQVAFEGLFENLGGLFRYLVGPYARLNAIGTAPTDRLQQRLAQVIQTPGGMRDRLTAGLYLSGDSSDALRRLDLAFEAVVLASPIAHTLSKAIKKRLLPKRELLQLVDLAVEKQIITAAQAHQFREAERLRLDAIQVDSFTQEQYLKRSV